MNKIIFVFDFDCTLTQRHFFTFMHNMFLFTYKYDLYGVSGPLRTYYNNPMANINKTDLTWDIKSIISCLKKNCISENETHIEMLTIIIFGSVDRFKKIKEMIFNLKRLGNSVCVLSNENKIEISAILNFLNFNIFDDIYLKPPEHTASSFKQDVLTRIMAKVKDKSSEYNCLFYVDDNHLENKKFILQNNMSPSQSYRYILSYSIPRSAKKYMFYSGLLKRGKGLKNIDIKDIMLFANSEQPSNESLGEFPLRWVSITQSLRDDDKIISQNGGIINIYKKNKNDYDNLKKFK